MIGSLGIRAAASELFKLLRCEGLAMLRAYFDESGTHGGAVTAIAGYVATLPVWDSVERRWSDILDTYRIRVFHMKDFLQQRGEFERMTTPMREDLIRALINVIVTEDVHTVWSAADASVWDQATTGQFRSIFPKPYDLCFHGLLRQVDGWSRNSGNSRVAMVFAIQDEYNRRSERVLDVWCRYKDIDRLGPITFDSPRKLPALQTADMLVHELRAAWISQVFGSAMAGKIRISPILKEIWKESTETGAFMGPKAIRLHVANADWLDPSFPCPMAK